MIWAYTGDTISDRLCKHSGTRDLRFCQLNDESYSQLAGLHWLGVNRKSTHPEKSVARIFGHSGTWALGYQGPTVPSPRRVLCVIVQ